MIKLENTEVLGWEAAIRGMRNPMNSWEKSDSIYSKMIKEERESMLTDHPIVYEIFSNGWIKYDENGIIEKNISDSTNEIIGPNDHDLMMRLAKAGSVDAKYRRMIVVTVDITAPLYWWKEFDTYKVGTVANSCSTMHKIQAKEFTFEDFSCEHLIGDPDDYSFTPAYIFSETIRLLNKFRDLYNNEKDPKVKKECWWQMIQLLPSSYNQRRTVMLNYEVLAGIYPKRKNHKLDEWHDFCAWIESLPYSEIITLQEGDIHGESAT